VTSEDTDNPGVIAFPPLILLVSAVISALVHFFLIQLPIMSYNACLVCGIVLVILAPTLAILSDGDIQKGGNKCEPVRTGVNDCARRAVSFHAEPDVSRALFASGRAWFFSKRLDHSAVCRSARADHALRRDPAEERISHRKFGEPYLN